MHAGKQALPIDTSQCRGWPNTSISTHPQVNAQCTVLLCALRQELFGMQRCACTCAPPSVLRQHSITSRDARMTLYLGGRSGRSSAQYVSVLLSCAQSQGRSGAGDPRASTMSASYGSASFCSSVPPAWAHLLGTTPTAHHARHMRNVASTP